MGNLREIRLGETSYNSQNELMTIVKYNGATDMLVQFYETGTIKKCAYKEFQNGHIVDNFYPTVCDVGYIGDTTIVEGKRKVKNSYRRWANMLLRCYDEKLRNKNPTYADCYVCDEWLCYANFEKWYNENYYKVDHEIMHLDKDILFKNNKLYSPKTCIFVPQRINALFTKCNKVRGDYPIGVTFSKKVNKYEPQVQGCGWLGYYDTPEEAFQVYKKTKEQFIKQIADEYKDKIPLKLYDSLYRYEVEITD